MSRKKAENQPKILRPYLSPVLHEFPELSTLVSLTGLHAIIYGRIWEFILNGDLGPGAKIPELQIGEAFKVSRTIVRNVLIVMEQVDIIILPPNRGAYVATHTVEKIQHAFEGAEVAAKHVARSLAANVSKLSERSRSQLERHVAHELPQEISRTGRGDMRLGLELLILLSALHGNSLLTAALDRVIGIILISSAQFQYRQAVWPTAGAQREIIELVLAGEADKVEQAVGQYIASLQQTFDYRPQERSRDVYSLISSLSDGVNLKTATRRRAVARKQERK